MHAKIDELEKIKVGAVSYLNTKPLLYGIERSETLMSRIELVQDYPSRIAAMLVDGTIDIGLAPVAVIPKLNEWHIVSDYCIGATGDVANALLEHLAGKLPISRLQRDLTDSTVLRNLGVPVAHTFIAFKSLEKGLEKLLLNEAKLKEDLEQNWAVVAEAIQTILRRENYPNPYEALKDLTRGKTSITKADIHGFIASLKVSAEIKKELKTITPHNYTGVNPVF